MRFYYENKQGNRFDLSYGELGSGLNVDNENKDFIILTGSHGEKIYYLRAQKADDDSSMTWIGKDNITKFNMMGDLPEEELLKLQENIRISTKILNLNIKYKKIPNFGSVFVFFYVSYMGAEIKFLIQEKEGRKT